MGEVWFYHLKGSSMEAVLPGLLDRTLERGWRAVVRAGTPERVEALDALLWVQPEEGFRPHGTPASPHPDRQPVYLTAGREVPNGADALFLVDGAGADLEEMARLTRTLVFFDDRDPVAVEAAREDWKRVTAAGLAATYWAEDGGRWVKRFEKPAAG